MPITQELQTAQRLQKAGLSPEASAVIAEKLEEAATLAQGTAFDRFRAELRSEMGALRSEMGALRLEVSEKIGAEPHERTLRTLLCKHGQFIHALELSGIRSWQENQSVLHLADGCNQLLISGGDRHGCEPNAALNLTNAQTFTEFVHQVRKERMSHVLFMPQYTEPLTLRMLQQLLDIIREYPDYSSGSRQWDERTFHPDHAGVVRPLSTLWEKPPFYIRHFFSVVRLLETNAVRRALRLALARPQQEASFVLGERQEALP